MYSFVRTGIPVEVLVIDAVTRLPIEGATVLNGCTSGSSLTDVNGIAVADMEDDQECKFTASAADYEENSEVASTINFADTKLIVEIPLTPISDYTLEGFVFDETTGSPIEGATVTATPEEGEGLEALTDAAGFYEFDLTEGLCYSVRATKADYLSDKAGDLCAVDSASSKVLSANLFLQPTVYGGTEEGRINVPDTDARVYQEGATGEYVDAQTGKPADGVINGSTYDKGKKVSGGYDLGFSDVKPGESIPYLLHIYYDFNMATIRAEAREDLDALYATLTDNPEVVIEIGSHTDARGSSAYNERLSQRRAEAVVRYLEQRGVSRERLVARGYGETKPVNNCNNNIPCSEREHQFNRRTEFRVLADGDGGGVEAVSRPREDIEVSRCKNCPF